MIINYSHTILSLVGEWYQSGSWQESYDMFEGLVGENLMYRLFLELRVGLRNQHEMLRL